MSCSDKSRPAQSSDSANPYQSASSARSPLGRLISFSRLNSSTSSTMFLSVRWFSVLLTVISRRAGPRLKPYVDLYAAIPFEIHSCAGPSGDSEAPLARPRRRRRPPCRPDHSGRLGRLPAQLLQEIFRLQLA